MNELRDIKFRGKRVDNREWIYGFYVEAKSGRTPFNTGYILETDADFSYGDNGNRIRIGCFVEIDRKTLGQYIGIKDCCGCNYFDGDIFKIDIDGKIKKYWIEWIEDGWYAVNISTRIYQPILNSWAKMSCICGNVHDNPEMLEENKDG